MDKKDLTIGIIITLVLAISGTYVLVGDDDAYYCESRDIVMICEKLSAANDLGIQTRCYYEDTYKICNEGWQKIEIGLDLAKEYNLGRSYLCNQVNCTEIINGIN